MKTIDKTTTIPEVAIEDIDRSLMKWFQDMNIVIDTNDQKNYKVPYIPCPQERFVWANNNKGLRDQAGVLTFPVITTLRTNIDRSPGLWAAGVDSQFVEIQKVVDKKSQDWKKGKPVYKITSFPFPTFVAVDYDLKIHTSTMMQMNTILQQLFKTLKFWQHFNVQSSTGMNFVGIFNFELNNESNLSEFSDDKRIIQYRNNIRLIGYLQSGEAKVEYSSTDIVFGIDTVSDRIADNPFNKPDTLMEKYREMQALNIYNPKI